LEKTNFLMARGKKKKPTPVEWEKIDAVEKQRPSKRNG